MLVCSLTKHVKDQNWFTVATPPTFRSPPRRRGSIWNAATSRVFRPPNLGDILISKIDPVPSVSLETHRRDNRIGGMS